MRAKKTMSKKMAILAALLLGATGVRAQVPVLNISGDSVICISNACALSTAPAVSALWAVYDLACGDTVVTSDTGTAFAHRFDHAGRYRITASHPDYPNGATFLLEVNDTPPAPTVADLDPRNRHTACYYGGIALDGKPSQPGYDLVWHPVSETATPQWYTGDSVVIYYQREVSDVEVYNYNRTLRCRSADHYVHSVEVLEPEELKIAHDTTVRPGTLLVFDSTAVPDQSREGMLYEWSIQPMRQLCASVQGSHFKNGITLAVNELEWSEPFYVKLERKFCGMHNNDYVVIRTDSLAQEGQKVTPQKDKGKRKRRRVNCEATAGSRDVTITAELNRKHTACDNTPVKFTATLNYPGEIESAYWDFGDGSKLHAAGDTVYHTFAAMMICKVNVTVTDSRGCTTTNKKEFHVSSYENPYEYASIFTLGPEARPFVDTKFIMFAPATDSRYTWWRLKDTSRVSATNYYGVTQPDDYFVHVVDINGCQVQASVFVPFLNVIKRENTENTTNETTKNK